MQPFSGRFFVVTRHSLYCVTVPEDLTSKPIVKKWHTVPGPLEDGRTMEVPIGSTFWCGYYIGITAEGMFSYPASETPPGKVVGLPPSFEQVTPRRICGTNVTRTKSIVALFLDHREAESCFEAHSRMSFDSRWKVATRATLFAIGLEHPLVTISRTGRFAVPSELYTPI